jgi:uncharacterized protein (TIGR00269 family)
MFDGELDIIRPMAYVEEKEIVRYAKKENLPVKNCQCPYGSKSQRRNVKEIINGLEKVCPQVKSNIFNSLKRIKKDHLI